jgi:hypothetical protein
MRDKIDKLELEDICVEVTKNVYGQPDIFEMINKINEIIDILNEESEKE